MYTKINQEVDSLVLTESPKGRANSVKQRAFDQCRIITRVHGSKVMQFP